MALYSQIKLYDRNGRWVVQIEHAGYRVRSGRYADAADAYVDAESRLIDKPGYVQAVPKDER